MDDSKSRVRTSVEAMARAAKGRAASWRPDRVVATRRTRPNTSLDLAGARAWRHVPGDSSRPQALRTIAAELDDGLPFTKWDHYFDVYDEVLGELAASTRAGTTVGPVRVLEIGVFKGGSLNLWRRYFGEEAVIFGIDIDPACARIDLAGAEVRIGSQVDAGFMQAVVAEMGGVDVVIDDGSHRCAHVIESLRILYPLLAWEGIYVVEDLAASYWPDYGGGLRRRGSSVEMLKGLIDELNSPYFDALPSALNGTVRHENLASIQFFDSMAVLRKRKMSPPQRSGYGRRPDGLGHP